jgi:hypothetical protein
MGMEPSTMLGEDGTHLLNGERVDFVASAQMGGPKRSMMVNKRAISASMASSVIFSGTRFWRR